MLATAEVMNRTEPVPISMEQYGLSMKAMREVGRMAVARAKNLEQLGITKQLRGEFDSCVFEGLSSDEEHGRGLRVTKFKEYPIVDSMVMSEDGETPVLELIENGQESSRAAAIKDRRMWTQHNRDKNDVSNAQEVGAMVAGERDYNTRLVVSCEPAEAIERDGIEYWNKKGYIKDTAYIQFYHHSEGDELLTGSLSFRAKDKAVLRAKLSKFGIEIPEDESVDNYINYALTDSLSEDDAKKLALSLRELCEDRSNQKNIDTVNILEKDGDVIETTFREMYLPVAESLAQKRKTDKTSQIVATFMAESKSFDPEVRRQLMKIHNSRSFDDDDARLLHQLTVYAAIERLRTALSKKSPL